VAFSIFKEGAFLMKKNTAHIKQLVLSSMLIALSIILTRVLSIQLLPTVRYSFGKIPIFIAGILLGPVWGGLVGALSDIIGYMLNPMGPYFFGFSLSAALAGILPPLLLRSSKRKPLDYKWNNFLFAIGISDCITGLFLKSIWTYLYLLYFLNKESVKLSLLANIPQFIILLPLNVIIISLLYPQLKRVYHQ
jgi:ECF transporter S component (folate family)